VTSLFLYIGNILATFKQSENTPEVRQLLKRVHKIGVIIILLILINFVSVFTFLEAFLFWSSLIA